jgi:hypothetical protein
MLCATCLVLKTFLALLRKTATLQILLNRAEQKQRSCNIFVAVCVSARSENTDISLSSVAATSFLTANYTLHGMVLCNVIAKAKPEAIQY